MPNNIKLPFRKSHAFIVGINDYQHISKLRTAVKDASDIGKLLENIHKYQIHSCLNANKAMLLEFIEGIKEIIQSKDRVVFYFAGHGIAIDSEKDPEGFLVPVDADPANKESLISMDVLHHTLNELPCKHGLLILDCCFAGSFKWSTGFRDTVKSFPKILYAERFMRFVEHPAWQVITSSAHDQKAADVLNKQALGLREDQTGTDIQNSPFAFALKQALNTHSIADISSQNKRSDGVLTATELYLHLRNFVETSTASDGKRQSPSIFTLGKHDTKGEYIFVDPAHPLNLPHAPERNPYKGLSPYEYGEEDAQIFFGRKHIIQELAHKLTHTPLLVVSAPSGRGKSSTVKAGLFPALKNRGYQQFDIFRPADSKERDWEDIGNMAANEKRVILIDQYEELFHLPDKDRKTIEDKLSELLKKLTDLSEQENNTQGPPLKLIITIRSDFEWQLQTSALGKLFWNEKNIRYFLFRLPPLGLEELREIIVKPAWMVAYEFESEELIDQILEEVNHAPGALPMLSFSLHKLFEHRDKDKRLISRAAYEDKLGGVNGALRNHADSVYDALPDDDHKDFMRKLMLRMVRLNDGSYTRRRVYLKTISSNPAQPFLNELDYPDHFDATKDAVLKAMADALLVRNDEDEQGPFVEPMHDSLINFWPRCLQWIQDFGRENLILQRQLWQAVIEYHQSTPYGENQSTTNVARALWNNNPKLQQLQIAVTDPKDEWLCRKGWGEKDFTSVVFLLWEKEPSVSQMEETAFWNWYFKTEDPKTRYEKIQGQMDHWLNENELQFVKASFEKQQSELQRLRTERDDALAAAEVAKAMISLPPEALIKLSQEMKVHREDSIREFSTSLVQKLKDPNSSFFQEENSFSQELATYEVVYKRDLSKWIIKCGTANGISAQPSSPLKVRIFETTSTKEDADRKILIAHATVENLGTDRSDLRFDGPHDLIEFQFYMGQFE